VRVQGRLAGAGEADVVDVVVGEKSYFEVISEALERREDGIVWPTTACPLAAALAVAAVERTEPEPGRQEIDPQRSTEAAAGHGTVDE
jgi:hypothetical protein